MRHFENIGKRLKDLESNLHFEKISTTDSAGNRLWMPISEKDVLGVYVSLLDIEAGADVPPELLDTFGLWARAELPQNSDPLLQTIQNEARRLMEGS